MIVTLQRSKERAKVGRLVDAFSSLANDVEFWTRLLSEDVLTELARWEPEDAVMLADDDCLDRVAEAFAKVVDAKSPWTYQHSTRVAEIAVGIADEFGCPRELTRDLRRAALLHDIGKLGVSNRILDKAGTPTPDEVVQIQKHPAYTQQILEQVAAFRKLADVASAHHERLDGKGYHRGLDASQLPWEARVLVVADVFEAMSAKRPYRDALPLEKIDEILASEAGRGFDADCIDALHRWFGHQEFESRVEEQMQEVERLLAEL